MAADVRKPARNEWPANNEGSSPTRLSMSFDDIGHALIGEPSTDFAALPDRAEQRAGGDTGFVAPCLQGRNRTRDRAPHNTDRGALAFLIGLAVADRDFYSRFALFDIFPIERDELRAAERAGKAQQQ